MAVNLEMSERFLNQYSHQIAFTMSSVALLFLSPFTFTFGSTATFAMHHYVHPEMKMRAKDKVIAIENVIFAIVGAVATFVNLTPAGNAGGIVFKATVLFGPYAVGTTAYRLYKSM